MATKKLSEALAELQKAASVSGLDVRLVVAGQSSTDNAQTITLQQLLTALNVPTPQINTNGNSGQYIYSNDADATKDVLCGVFKVFQNGTELKLCHKIWGSGNNKYDDGKYHTVDFPHVSTSSAGVFEAPMLVRLRNTTLKEVNSTTQAVNITYPNYKDGSTQVLTLSAATTAKAGVMTSEQVQLLNKLANTSITIDVVSDSKNGLMSAEMYKSLKGDTFQPSFGASNVQINYKGIDNTSKSFVLTGATAEQSGIMTAEQAKQLQNLVDNPTTSAKQYLKWDSANHKFTFVETEAESDAVIPLASDKNDGLISKQSITYLSSIRSKIETYNHIDKLCSNFDDFLTKAEKYTNDNLAQIITGYYQDDNYAQSVILIHHPQVTPNEDGKALQILFKDAKVYKRYITFIAGAITDRTDWEEVKLEYPIASATEDGLLSKENAKSLSDIQSNYKDFGHFDSESAALAKLVDLSVCADSNIVHAHMTYTNGDGKTTLILIQSIDGKECRQIIYNKMKVFHRTITFTDTNRTEVSWKEDWQFLFGDRLKWDKGSHKYLLSQFGNNFGSDYTDPIPLADTNTDGLMSKSQVSDLTNLKSKVENIKDEIPVATDSSNGLMSMAQVSDLVSLKKTAKRKKTQIFPPCVHKAIPLMPKKGRRYYNSKGFLHFDIKRETLENNNIDFTYVDNIVGSIQGIKILGEGMGVNSLSYSKCLHVNKGDDLTKYFHINKDNWITLFGTKASKIQLEVVTSVDYGNCIEILSDEAVPFSKDFKFRIISFQYSGTYKTASPFFVIEGMRVSYIRPITRNAVLANSRKSDNLVAFYYKSYKNKTTLKGERVSLRRRWIKVARGEDNYDNEFRLNKRSSKFRLYPCYKKWKKKIIGNSFLEVIRDKKCNIKKFLP